MWKPFSDGLGMNAGAITPDSNRGKTVSATVRSTASRLNGSSSVAARAA